MEISDIDYVNAIAVGKCCYTGKVLFLAEQPVANKSLVLATTCDTIFTFSNKKDSSIVKDWINIINEFNNRKNTNYIPKVIRLKCILKYIVEDNDLIDLNMI